MSRRRWYQFGVIAVSVLVLVLALRTCGVGRHLSDLEPGEEIDAALTLQTVTLEQPDENGNLLWRLKAKSVTYSPDSQRAELAGLEGDFFQAGKIIYTVTADRGEVQQNGETLYLRGNLVATGTENELTLEGEKLKWQPKQDLLVVGNFGDDDAFDGDARSEDTQGSDGEAGAAQNPSAGASEPAQGRSAQALLAEGKTADKLRSEEKEKAPVTGFSPQIEAIAQVISVSNQKNQVDLTGGVVAKSKAAPWLTFESDAIAWFTERKVIEANQPLKVEQYAEQDYQTVTDRVVGETGQVQLAQNIVTLNQFVQLDALTQPLKVVSEQAVWDVAAQSVTLDKPVNIEQPERSITATANQARLDLAQEVIYLTGNVRANGREKDSRLAADQITWQTSTQQVEAEGNVIYQQAVDPEISMAGSKAVGNLEQGTVVVTGGESGEVVTEIVPDDF